MIFPATTAAYASLFAIGFVALSFWVVFSRTTHQTLLGGGDSVLQRRIRIQGNFAEYVPFALGLIALLEARGASHGLVQGLLVLLVIARLLHPFGMYAPPNSPQLYVCRGGGTVSTLLVILVAALSLLFA